MERFFTYFIPGAQAVSAKTLAAAGLGHAFDGNAVKRLHTARGPGDKPGMLIADGRVKADIGYDPDPRIWRQMIGRGSWIGFDPAMLPGPADLIRKDAIGFYTAPLGDGRRWLVPTALFPDGASPLPKVRFLDPEGKVKRRVVKAHEQLWLYADKVACAVRSSEPINDDEEWAIAVECLNTNYRIGTDEASILSEYTDLFSDNAVFLILCALIDRGNWPDALGDSAEEDQEG